jgi:hypothetical protein
MMAEKPTNEKLWTMVVSQARSKYHPYPSPGASHWVHQRYVELGGKFEDTSTHSHQKKILQRMWENRLKEKQEAARKKKEGKKHGDKD